MPLKKSELEAKEQRRQYAQQSAQQSGAAQEWDETKSHRKDNKDTRWDKSTKLNQHHDRKPPAGTAKLNRAKKLVRKTKGALGRLK